MRSNQKPGPWTVLHVITKLELGGAQLATLHEIKNTTFAQSERYLAFGPGGLLDSEARHLAGVECIEIPSLRRELSPANDLAATLELAKLVRRLRRRHRDSRLLVHTHSSKAGIVGRLGATLGGAHCIVHSVHGFGHSHHGSPLSRPVLLAGERLAGRVTDGFTADSASNIVEGKAARLFCGRPARVVRCGIRVEEFAKPARPRGEVRRELGIEEDQPFVLTVACLKPQKDPLTWARVGRLVAEAHPRAVFALAGDGELRPELETFIAESGAGSTLRLLGWRRDIADLLHASDIALLTSRWEGLPQTLPQAMCAGLPIVATHVDGNPEAVTHDDNGYLFAPGDVAGMAEALCRLIADPELRRRMGERGRARAEEFSVERMMQDLDSFYREVTGG